MINFERSTFNRSTLLSTEPIYLDGVSISRIREHGIRKSDSDRNFFDTDEFSNARGHRPLHSSVDMDVLFGELSRSLARPSVTKGVLRDGLHNNRRQMEQSVKRTSFNRSYPTLGTKGDVVLKWKVAREIFRKWISLRTDWDNDDALPPSHNQLTAAFEFLKRAESFAVPEPEPYIASDSEIGFNWVGKGANVSFLIEGRFLAFCPVTGKDPVRVGGPLDIAAASTEMFKALSKLN